MPQSQLPPMHPDDVFHVILDAIEVVAKLTPADWERLNAGRPAWDWYDSDPDDIKTTADGWKAVAANASEYATAMLEGREPSYSGAVQDVGDTSCDSRTS